MAPSSVEVERKYDVPATDLPLPDLAGVDGVAQVEHLDDETLDATYYDTADLRLARSKATLRRRTGGRDAGWHLKLPAVGAGRHELTAPLRSRRVPAALTRLVRSRTRGARLEPVVRLQTTRAVLRLLDADGRVLAEVADDAVTAEALADDASGRPAQTSLWREVEVELVDGDEAVLDAVERHLGEWGAAPAASASKLARALGTRLSDRGDDDGGTAGDDDGGTAGDAVVRHLREQVQELVARDPMVRQDEPDAVHKMRVATRRLRSALKTFRPLLDRSVTDPLRAELKHLGAVLGEARDAEVLRDRLAEQLDAEPVELVLGPVAARVADELGRRYRAAHEAVVAELDGARFLALLEGLDALVTTPPLTDRAARGPGKELRRLVRRAWRRLAAAHGAAEAAGSPAERDHLLHEVRKAAKQARYAGEAVEPAVGEDAERFAERAEAVQEALGEHQDSVASRALLRELGVQAHLSGENGFTFGRLHGLEELRAERAHRAFAVAWDELSSKKVLRWLR
jgi:CHAD domain-containing protein